MPRRRRTAYLLLGCEDVAAVDVEAVLAGAVDVRARPALYAVSILRGDEFALSDDELDLLLSVPADRWVELADSPALAALVDRGLVLGDERPELLRRDEQLAASGWSVYAALYHSLTRWRDLTVAVELDDPEALEGVTEEFLAQYGPPPPHFHAREDAVAVHELPLPPPPDGELFGVLRARRTTRAFAVEASLPAAQAALVLAYAFGCHGYLPVDGSFAVLRKTSPSGGAMHAVEAYPLVVDVAGVEPGLYHYNVRDHSLELLEPLEREQARALADVFTCGQRYPRSAHVLVVLAARFDRSFWKYRDNDRAFSVVLMDAAHVAQTLYLVCTRLGLGAFVTAAVNAATIDERLRLDGFGEGALAVCGFGVPAARRSHLEPEFLPYVPREPQP